MLVRSFALSLLLSAIIAIPVFGDGKAYSIAVPVVQTPDQQALLVWNEGVETLVVETNLVGEGDEFAWVVPTPSVPEVSPATKGLFPTLQQLTHPKIQNNAPYFALPLLFVFCLIAAFRLSKPWSNYAFAVVVVFVIAVILLPALNTARSGEAIAVKGLAVDIIQRELIGSYEIVILSGDEGRSLVKWLNHEGFKVADDDVGVIDAYVQDGWVFTAARLRRESSSSGRLTPHPLTFRFETDQPVYPLRLTGVGNGNCRIDLYVAGSQRAIAPPFKTERCGKLDRGEGFDREDRIHCVHPAMSELTEGAAVLTRLSATLTPKQMAGDLTIGWKPYQYHYPLKFTKAAALELGFNIAFSFLLIVGIIWLTRKPLPKASFKVCSISIVIAAAAVALTYAALPTSKTRTTHWLNDSIRRSMTRSLGYDIEHERKKYADTSISLEQVRAWIKDIKQDDDRYERLGPIREEDSPGNYTLEEHDGKIIYTIYGRFGHAVPKVIWPIEKEEP